MKEIQDALKLAEDLEKAEAAKAPFQSQIDAFMQQEGELDEASQAAFEDWALTRLNINRAFRRAGIFPQEHWVSADYILFGNEFMKSLPA